MKTKITSTLKNLIFVFLFLLSKTTWAQFGESEVNANDGLIIDETNTTGKIVFERQEDPSLPYKQRRGKNGVLFGIASEKFYPLDYVSQYHDAYIENIIDKTPINLLNIELGYKRNMVLGAVSFLLGYADGKASGRYSNFSRDLSLQRTSAAVGFALDNLMNEPWVVPYVQGGVHKFTIKEKSGNPALEGSKTASTEISYDYRLGLLFQLNWIEKSIDSSTHQQGLISSGLENAFIDLYFVDHSSLGEHYDVNSAPGTGFPNLSSALEMGIGLKLEF